MKNIILVAVLSLIFSFLSGIFTIPLLKRIKAGQTILKYVDVHKSKNGTPTMGGLFFIIPSVIIFIVFYGFKNRLATMTIAIGLAFLAVGFIDDFIKIRSHKNEGLKPYQKIIFQTAIAVLAGVFAFQNGLTIFFIPFINTTVNLGYFSIIIIAIIFIAITNSVNLTDGLDGLSASVGVVYLIFLMSLIYIETTIFDSLYLNKNEYYTLISLSSVLVGGLLAFLIFNTNPASVFMGDTGSLSLGGFIGALSVFSSNSFYIPILGIMFVVSTLSVIIQVVYYKKTKKRVFLMAPLHHHLQLKGKSEAKITFLYVIISVIFGAFTLIFYL